MLDYKVGEASLAPTTLRACEATGAFVYGLSLRAAGYNIRVMAACQLRSVIKFAATRGGVTTRA